ncbi:MAG: peptidoglycan-associated lipoprotein Pal [Deltaproteobacteria bacterium]|nr:peptidoglycan-associated lipoprotein Pal [Deltaproteobacteria bacterium]
MKKVLMLAAVSLMVFTFVSGCATPKTSGKGTQVDSSTPVSTSDEVPYERGAIDEGLKNVYFDYDRYTLDTNARNVLKSNAAILKANEKITVTIEGHCDERGSNEYNLALGERRASAVKNYLTRLGVSSKRIKITSYGEEKPLCNQSNESCWQKNRRAYFGIN